MNRIFKGSILLVLCFLLVSCENKEIDKSDQLIHESLNESDSGKRQDQDNTQIPWDETKEKNSETETSESEDAKIDNGELSLDQEVQDEPESKKKVDLQEFTYLRDEKNISGLEAFSDFVDPETGKFIMDFKLLFERGEKLYFSGINEEKNIINILQINKSNKELEDVFEVKLAEDEGFIELYPGKDFSKQSEDEEGQSIYLLTSQRILVINESLIIRHAVDIPENIDFKSYCVNSDIHKMLYISQKGIRSYSFTSGEDLFLYSLDELNQGLEDDVRLAFDDISYINDSDRFIARGSGQGNTWGFVYGSDGELVDKKAYIRRIYDQDIRPFIRWQDRDYLIVGNSQMLGSIDPDPSQIFMLDLYSGDQVPVPYFLKNIDLGYHDDAYYQFNTQGFYGIGGAFNRYIYVLPNGTYRAIRIPGECDFRVIGDYYDSDGDLIVLLEVFEEAFKSQIITYKIDSFSEIMGYNRIEKEAFTYESIESNDYDGSLLLSNMSYDGNVIYETNIGQGELVDMVVYEDSSYLLIKGEEECYLLGCSLRKPDEVRLLLHEGLEGPLDTIGLQVIKDELLLVNSGGHRYILSFKDEMVSDMDYLLDVYSIEGGPDPSIYTYIEKGYGVIHVEGEGEKQIFKGYSNADAGESGFYVNIPTDLTYSNKGSYFSFFTSIYEGRLGPYIYNKSGEFIYSPTQFYSDYSDGEWISDSQFIPMEWFFGQPKSAIMDFSENKITYLPFDEGISEVEVCRETGKVAVHETDYVSLKEPSLFWIFEPDTYETMTQVSLFCDEKVYSHETRMQMYITDDEIITYHFDNGKIRIHFYEYEENYQEIKALGSEDLPLASGYVQLYSSLYGRTDGGSLDLFYRNPDTGHYTYVDTIDESNQTRIIPLVEEVYDNQILHVNKKKLIDIETGKQVENDWLDQALGHKSYEILASDISDYAIAYMIGYKESDSYQIETYFKFMAENEFRMVDQFNMGNDKVNKDGFYILIGPNSTLYMDHYNSDNGQSSILQYVDNELSLYKEMAKSPINLLETQWVNHGYLQYFDIEKGTYVIEGESKAKNLGYSIPIIPIHNGYTGFEINEEGTTGYLLDWQNFAVIDELFIEKRLLVQVESFGNMVRYTLLSWQDGKVDVLYIDHKLRLQ